MKNLLIGSRALAIVDPSFKCSPDADWDVISPYEITGCEWHDPWLLNNEDLDAYAMRTAVLLPCGEYAYPVNAVGLSLIKRSHLHRDIGFDKHIAMYHRHLSYLRIKWDNADIEFLKERIRATEIRFPQHGPNLNQTKDDFFDDAVVKKYDHDYLHELVAYNDSPMYTRMLRGDGTVFCRKEVWDTFSHEEKLQTAAEETTVIAIERFMVPKEWDFNSRIAYNRSLKKVCTTLCKGWFRDFAIDNYPALLGMFDKQRILNVKSKLGV